MDLKRLTVSTYPLIREPLDKALGIIAAAGFQRVDILGKLPHLSLDPKECDIAVAAGTTIGMMAANVPAVLLGDVILRRAPLKLIRVGAAVVFALLGAATLIAAFAGWRLPS